MHPTILSIGNFSISSFGFFASLAFIAALFTIWRLSRVYDIDEEKTLDITLLTFFGGLIGSRVAYVLTNLSQFDSLKKMILLNRYPGLNFWGGAVLGFLTLYLFTRRLKITFCHMADFITVGFFAALIFGSFGCLLGTCQYGFPYSGFLSVPQVGLVGNRFPTQLLETLAFYLAFVSLWKMCLRFHWSGKVVSIGLILLGVIKFFAEFLRADTQMLISPITEGQLLSVVSLLLGVYIFYTQSKRSLRHDLQSLGVLLSNHQRRNLALSKTARSWYNFRVTKRVRISRMRKHALVKTKTLLRNINVKTHTPGI